MKFLKTIIYVLCLLAIALLVWDKAMPLLKVDHEAGKTIQETLPEKGTEIIDPEPSTNNQLLEESQNTDVEQASAMSTPLETVEKPNEEPVSVPKVNAPNIGSSVKNNVMTFSDFASVTDPNVFFNEIELSPHSTRIQLTIAPNNFAGAYCLWDVGDPNAYHLIDVESNTTYFLEKQISPVGSCNKGEWYQLFRYETADIQLFFPPLAEGVTQIKLIEGNPEDGTTSAHFAPIELVR